MDDDTLGADSDCFYVGLEGGGFRKIMFTPEDHERARELLRMLKERKENEPTQGLLREAALADEDVKFGFDNYEDLKKIAEGLRRRNGISADAADAIRSAEDGLRRAGTLPLIDAETRVVRRALLACRRLFAEALPKFNWGASALDANAIRLLNETPAKVDEALSILGARPDDPNDGALG